MKRRTMASVLFLLLLFAGLSPLAAQDTDDDGFPDVDEVNSGVMCGGRSITHPQYSRSPLIQRSLSLAGAPAGYSVIDSNRFDLADWTIECWVRPTVSTQTVVLVERVTLAGPETTFRLHLSSGIPAVQFSKDGRTYQAGGTGINSPIPTGTWTHVAGVWDSSSDSLSLYVNGSAEQSVWVWDDCARGTGVTTIGIGLTGFLDDLRIWNTPRTRDEIDAGRWRFGVGAKYNGGVGGSSEGLVAYYPFDDGGTTFEDFTHLADWTYALSGGTADSNTFVNLGGLLDDDSDAIPDWWEYMFARGDADPLTSLDSDDLNNLYEYYCDTNPNFRDTDNDGTSDDDEDADGDGLRNGDEQEHGSDPRIGDTDDDGLGDQAEQLAGSDPADSLSPFTWRALALSGINTSYMDMPPGTRFGLRQWTVEAWVQPAAGWSSAGNVAVREVEPGEVNYALSINAAGLPIAAFGNNSVTGTVPVVTDGATWTHLAASYDSATRRLSIIVNGELDTGRIAGSRPRDSGVGPVTQRVGQGFNGLIAELRLWGVAVPVATIASRMNLPLGGGEAGLVAYYRFDDGTSFAAGTSGTSLVDAWDYGQVEDFVQTYPNDWLVAWGSAGSLHGAVITDLVSTEVPFDGDSDNDGMPDGWEIGHELDPNDPSDATDDPDDDDLSNLYEYYCQTDPNNSNTDGDLLPDGLEDFDLDGLVNMFEEDEGTDPRLPDTDDDGVADLTELMSGFSPIDSLSPLYWRALSFAGNPGCYVALPLSDRFALPEWTVEAWVRPAAGATGASTVLRREAAPGQTTYLLAIDGTMRPTAGFDSTMVTAPDAIAADGDTWTHLAATFDAATQRLRLYVNGVQVASRLSVLSPPSTPDAGSLHRLGESFEGLIDEPRVWSVVRSESQIATASQQVLTGAESGLVAYYRADDGTAFVSGSTGTSLEPSWLTGQVEDFVAGLDQDWQTGWQAAGSLVGGCVFTNLALLDLPIDEDSDNDGMPDIWEIVNGLDPTDPADALEDPDGDHLVNLYEYYCETDPNNSNTDGDGTPDGEEDFDGDGLLNLGEQDAGSDPRLPDTDDDGLGDLAEVDGGLNPTSSLVPLTWRVLALPGDASSYAEMPNDARFGLSDWTIEAWVLPTNGWSRYGSVLTRTSQPGITNYFLAIDASRRPVAGFGNQTLAASAVLADDGATWTHLAATFDAASRRLALFVNGVPAGVRTCTASPVAVGSGAAAQRIGEGFAGLIDEVRLWSSDRSESEITASMSTVLSGSDSGLVAYYRFDDGTSFISGSSGTSLVDAWNWGQIEEFTTGYAADWLARWANAASLRGTASLTVLARSDNPLGEDSDGDGMPDDWELEHGLDPFDPLDADDDLDGDGLTNLYEYYSDTDPNDRDTDDDGEWDGAEDRDGDGLENQDEQTHRTDPRLPDTDDDGLSDLEEKLGPTDPADSLDPLAWRALSLPGDSGSYVSMPVSERFELTDWTLEVWVQPGDTWLGGGTLIHRDIEPGETNYFLAVDGTLAPVAGFGENAVTSDTAIAADGSTWTHLAATYVSDGQWLRFYVNGEETASRICSANPRFAGLGPVVQRIGVGLSGLLDEVRIWSVARTQEELRSTMNVILTGSESGLVSHYRFDDGTSYEAGATGTSDVPSWEHGQVEDFAAGLERNWEVRWQDAATLNGSAVFSDDGAGAPVLPPQSLRITLHPDTVGTGAQWRVWLDSEWSEWQESGAILLDLSPGAHTTEYTEVSSWIQPSNELVSVTTTAAVNIVRYYALLIGDYGKETGEFVYPRGLAVYDDYVYVADSANHRIQRLDVSTSPGTWRVLGRSGTGAGEFNQPFGVAVDANGNLYVADSNNNRIQRRNASSGSWTVWGGTAPGTAVGSFNGPFDVAVDTNGNLYVADHYNHRIQKRSPGGTWSVIVDPGFDDDETRHPNGVEISPDGNLVVSDYDGIGNHSRIRTFTTDGTLVGNLASSLADEGAVLLPMHMTYSTGDKLFVADSGNDRVIRYGGSGYDWSDLTHPGFLKAPWSVAIDRHDRLYIADTGNHRVLRLDLDTPIVPTVRRAQLTSSESTFKWVGKAGWSYTVEYKDSLSDAGWKVLPGYADILSNGGVMSCVDTAAPSLTQRFYRVRAK